MGLGEEAARTLTPVPDQRTRISPGWSYRKLSLGRKQEPDIFPLVNLMTETIARASLELIIFSKSRA